MTAPTPTTTFQPYISQHYPLVDILRGFAALLVLWYHVIVHSGWNSLPPHGFFLLPRAGWVGVDLFFVISGFVIGKTAIENYMANPTGWRPGFIDRRWRRIAPLYFLNLLVYLFIVSPDILQRGGESLWHVVSHVLFIHNATPSTSGSINGVNWSVALEMQFYLLMVFATPWLARTSSLRVLLVWIALALGWRYGTTLIYPPGASDPTDQRVLSSQLPGTLDQFVMGIVLAKLAMQGFLQYTPKRLLAWSVAAAVLLSAAWITFWPRSNYWYLHSMVIFWRTLLSAGFVALLAVFVILPFKGSGIFKPLRYLGEISYGIYLWHVPILMTLVAKTTWREVSLMKATLIGSIILSAFTWHFFEKKWLRCATRPHPTPDGAAGKW